MRSMVFSWSSIRARQAPWEAACVKPLSCGAGEGGARSAPGEGPALREERPHPPLRGTFSRTREKGVRSVVNHGADRLAVMHQVERLVDPFQRQGVGDRSEEHTSELQSLMRISYAVFCLKKTTNNTK